MARDRTARSRIRRHLAESGPVVDIRGQATKQLKDAVGYSGSPVAFIQLVAAMERDGEVVRDIRGKRTYRIAGVGSVVESVAVLDTPEGRLTVDYDALARSLLRELTAGESVDPNPARAGFESRRIAQDRNEYARRLDAARTALAELAHLAPRRPARQDISPASWPSAT
ncbi:hypothetical protein GCM10009798_04330 [Nocardioides panacihumi]|uniref:Uncharacterized protein n=1 Tax=Nocardioides panacihumi TaxID=400774 RepID=A0ABN2QAD8_9ACTN